MPALSAVMQSRLSRDSEALIIGATRDGAEIAGQHDRLCGGLWRSVLFPSRVSAPIWRDAGGDAQRRACAEQRQLNSPF